MKIKDILKESGKSPEIEKWCNSQGFRLGQKDQHGRTLLDVRKIDGFLDDDGNLDPSIDDIKMLPKIGGIKFEWPIKCGKLFRLELDGHEIDRDAYVIDNFRNFPDVITLDIGGASVIESFDGIQDIHGLEKLIITRFVKINDTKLLRLLKHPTLKEIYNLPRDNLSHAQKALMIISKHIESKDIADCMDELIEAGLKEYAKL